MYFNMYFNMHRNTQSKPYTIGKVSNPKIANGLMIQ